MMQMLVSRRRSLAASLIFSQGDEGAASFTDSLASLPRNAIQDIIRGVHRNWIVEGTKTWHHKYKGSINCCEYPLYSIFTFSIIHIESFVNGFKMNMFSMLYTH